MRIRSPARSLHGDAAPHATLRLSVCDCRRPLRQSRPFCCMLLPVHYMPAIRTAIRSTVAAAVAAALLAGAAAGTSHTDAAILCALGPCGLLAC